MKNDVIRKVRGMLQEYENDDSVVNYGFWKRDYHAVRKRVDNADTSRLSHTDKDTLNRFNGLVDVVNASVSA